MFKKKRRCNEAVRRQADAWSNGLTGIRENLRLASGTLCTILARTWQIDRDAMHACPEPFL